MELKSDYSEDLNRSIGSFYQDVLRIAASKPAIVWFFLRSLIWQRSAARRRREWKKQGIQVPPFMIVSVTNRCNLRCKGCYAQALRGETGKEMDEDTLRRVVEQAHEIGVSIMILAGGEPLVRKDIMNITREFKEITFFLFTNGLLMTYDIIRNIKKQKNVVPVFSLEGYEEETDGRRGKGVYAHLLNIVEDLKKARILWGVSLTITTANYGLLSGGNFVKDFFSHGCRMFFFPEYVPIKDGTRDLILDPVQRDAVSTMMQEYRRKFPAVFITFPEDEDKFGGCLSAGRGFIHVSAEGSLEPCPFAPYSTSNLRSVPLKEALQSDFLRTIRAHHRELSEVKGTCALWEKREWLATVHEQAQQKAKEAV